MWKMGKNSLKWKQIAKDVLNEITLHNTLQWQKMWRLKRLTVFTSSKEFFPRLCWQTTAWRWKTLLMFVIDDISELNYSTFFPSCNHYKNILWIFCLNWELKAAFQCGYFYWKHMAHIIGRFRIDVRKTLLIISAPGNTYRQL